MTIDRLRTALGNLADTKGVLAILGDRPLEEKRADLYPDLVPLVVATLSGEQTAHPGCARMLIRFFAKQHTSEPTLAPQLYEAIGSTPVRHERDALFDLITRARDRSGIALLRGGAEHANWTDAVIALSADELLDEAIAALATKPTRELAVACACVGGERAREALGSGTGDAVHPIGLAFLANHDDKALFADGKTPNRTTARRIHTLFTAKGPKQRIDALGELGEALASSAQPVGVERLMACTLALADKRADVVERAASILAAHAQAQRAQLRPVFFPAFLEQAARAIAVGTTETARRCLDAVHARIPNALPLGAAKVVAAPPTRKAAAKAKSKQMLETMPETSFDNANQRDAGIEAQIAADPGLGDSYMVYADWLQMRGDARGAWITLHTLKGLAAREALATFLRDHRESLLGPVREFIVEDGPVELEWFMGFVKRARFSAQATEAVVRALLDSTCGAFVQELAFADDELAPAVTTLLAAKRPQTLSRLAFGAHDEPPAELVAVIPRLHRDPTAQWGAALARLAELRTVRVDLEPDDVPALRGADMSVILHGLKQELGLDHPIGFASAMTRRFPPAALDAFACALGQAWFEAGQAERLQWAMRATGPLGGTRTARFLGTTLGELRSTARITAALDQLRQIGTPTAIEEIVWATHAPGLPPRVAEHAQVALDAVFADDPDTEFAATPPAGDPRSREVEALWLTMMMVDGREMSRAGFDGLLAHRAASARSLLWADREALFRVDDSGSTVRLDGRPHQTSGSIALVHPAELCAADLDDARRAFAGVQAIVQLARPCFGLSVDDARTTELTSFVKRRVGFQPIAAALRARGWQVVVNDVEEDYDGEDRWVGTRAFARDFARDDVSVVATLNETRGSIASVRVLRGANELAFEELHVVTISELLWDLEVAHGWREAAPQRAPEQPPPPRARGPAPVVERAKSGRSKCVVCTEAIAKDSVRIGVERMVETPTFRGRATVWLHPACRTGVPELAGVELDGVD